jgi:hypothetical protein
VYPYFDLIGPLGSHLPMSHRRQYNRPTNIGGKLAYCFNPSSQEAMAWHNARHRGLYKHHRPRTVMHYFYPKTWQALRVGPRTKTTGDDESAASAAEPQTMPGEAGETDGVELIPQPVPEPLADQLEMIEP